MTLLTTAACAFACPLSMLAMMLLTRGDRPTAIEGGGGEWRTRCRRSTGDR